MTMTATTTARLAAHVAAVNRCNAAADVLTAVARHVAQQFHGTKVRTKAGEPAAKFSAAIMAGIAAADGATVNGHHGRTADGVQFWLETSTASVWLNFKTCETANGIASYHNTGEYLGGLDSAGVLTATADEQERHALKYRRSNWTVAEVEELRHRAREAEEAAREARGACGPFGD
jgi:hypothetical protein